MKKFVLIFGLLLVFMILLVGCEGVTTPGSKDYVWSEPEGHFKVTIPGSFVFKEKIQIPNPKVLVYKFLKRDTKEETPESLTIWWEDKTVHNITTLQERVQYNINHYGESQPLVPPTSYNEGIYWVQQRKDFNVNILYLCDRILMEIS